MEGMEGRRTAEEEEEEEAVSLPTHSLTVVDVLVDVRGPYPIHARSTARHKKPQGQ